MLTAPTKMWARTARRATAGAPRRFFCDQPAAAPVAYCAADWVDPRGSYVSQRKAYKAQISELRKKYAADVAAQRGDKLREHNAKMLKMKESNAKSNVEAKSYATA